MPIRTITGPVYRPNSSVPWTHAGVQFELQHVLTISGIVYPREEHRYQLDQSGDFSAYLTVPASGAALWRVTLPDDSEYDLYLTSGESITLAYALATALTAQSYDSIISLLEDQRFIDLSDTPDSYTGHEGQIARVTISGTGIEFVPLGSGNDAYYRHVQAISSASWIVPHGLAKYPSITVVDTSGDTCYGLVHYDSENQVTITFSAPFSGEAYCN